MDATRKTTNNLGRPDVDAGTPSDRRTHGSTMERLGRALAYAQSIIDTVREPMLVLDAALHVQTGSRAFFRTFGVSREDTEGRFIYDLGNGEWNIPALRTLLEDTLAKSSSFRDFELEHAFPDCRVMSDEARVLLNILFPKLPSRVWPID